MVENYVNDINADFHQVSTNWVSVTHMGVNELGRD